MYIQLTYATCRFTPVLTKLYLASLQFGTPNGTHNAQRLTRLANGMSDLCSYAHTGTARMPGRT